MPPCLDRLKKLRYLNISENAFEEFPESVCGMASLIELRASDNKLTSLLDSIGPLARLRELHLPTAIAALPRLEKLDLRRVTTLPIARVDRKSRTTTV